MPYQHQHAAFYIENFQNNTRYSAVLPWFRRLSTCPLYHGAPYRESIPWADLTREKRWGWACGSAIINTQKRIKKRYPCCFNPGVKWQLQRSCFVAMSPVCVQRTDFIPSFSPHRQIPVTWNLFRRRVNFTLKELGSIIDSTYGTVCHCIVSKCFFLSFFPSIADSLFHHTLSREEGSFILPFLSLSHY